MGERPPSIILRPVPPELLDDGLTPDERAAIDAAFHIPELPPLARVEPLFQEARLALQAWCRTPPEERPAMHDQITRILIRDGVFRLTFGSVLRFVSIPPHAPLSA